jgi:hypothetical protein
MPTNWPDPQMVRREEITRDGRIQTVISVESGMVGREVIWKLPQHGIQLRLSFGDRNQLLGFDIMSLLTIRPMKSISDCEHCGKPLNPVGRCETSECAGNPPY